MRKLIISIAFIALGFFMLYLVYNSMICHESGGYYARSLFAFECINNSDRFIKI